MTTDDRRRLAGRYVLDAPIGRGGMGEVWRATDTVLGRQVAVKTIDLRRVPDESGAARFEREAKVTAGMSHPNVVTVHDTGVEDDTAYLVMELLPGPSLADRIAEGPLPVEDVVDVARQVSSALDAAHRRGLVHRDIKPANLVHDSEGRIRVLDFGITQLGDTTGEQALTATHTVMGTAEYLAPEQATGGRVDGRADLYALGCVLFAALAGRAPFRGPTPVATMMMHANDPVPDVRELRPDTPAWLAGLVGSLLAKDPAGRPADAAAVTRAVDDRTAPAVAGAAAAGAAATSVLPSSGADPTARLAATPPPPPPPAVTPRPGPAPRRRGAGGAQTALWALAVIAVIALGVFVWSLLADDTAGEPAASTPPTTSAAAPTTTAPEQTPTPTETPTPEEEEPGDPDAQIRDAYAALSSAAADLESRGEVDKDVTKTIDERSRETDKALREGDADKVAEEADKLADDYAKAVEEGKVSQDAAATLDPLVQDLLDAADAYRGGGAEGEGDD